MAGVGLAGARGIRLQLCIAPLRAELRRPRRAAVIGVLPSVAHRPEWWCAAAQIDCQVVGQTTRDHRQSDADVMTLGELCKSQQLGCYSARIVVACPELHSKPLGCPAIQLQSDRLPRRWFSLSAALWMVIVDRRHRFATSLVCKGNVPTPDCRYTIAALVRTPLTLWMSPPEDGYEENPLRTAELPRLLSDQCRAVAVRPPT